MADKTVTTEETQLTPQRYEWEALDMWHLDQEIEAANKQDYSEADAHKKRRAEIRKMLHGKS
jgi:hypothetical protein